MAEVVLDKGRLAAFVAFLAGEQNVQGPVPVAPDGLRLGPVTSLAQMRLDGRPPLLPPKKYLFPPIETLLRYDTTDGQVLQALVEVEDQVLFGLRPCDLAGLQCLGLVFSEPPKELNVLVRGRHLTLIGIDCQAPCDSAAGCCSLRSCPPQGGYDLLLTELDTDWFVQVGTAAGERLVRAAGLFAAPGAAQRKELAERRAAAQQRFSPELPLPAEGLPALLAASVDSPVWDDLERRCLACGNCTAVCPTCSCFDLVDAPDLGRPTGRRLRLWDSCQNQPFAAVAGGDNFRPGRGERQRHRFARKFQFPMARFGRLFCTGCGRCSRACMAGIDLKATLKALADEQGV